jgi:hypothetical protein
MFILNFNAAAAELLRGREGAKMRVEFKNGELRARPTDRKAGPHVLVEHRPAGRNGIAISFDEKQAEKLGASFSDAATYHVVKDKYGWFTLAAGEAEGNDTKVTVKADA